jgi:hypothetical protein
MAGASGAVAAAERDWQEVVRHFEGHGAVSPDRAISLPPDDRLSPRVIAQLRRDGDLRETDAGMVWLDVARAVKRRRQENRLVGRLLIAASVVAIAAFLFAMS